MEITALWDYEQCLLCHIRSPKVHPGSQPAREDVQEAVLKSFYVDTCLRSLSSEEEARALVDKLQALLAEGGFELLQWASN